MSARLIRILSCLLSLAGAVAASGQGIVSFQARTEATEVTEGKRFEVSFVLFNAEGSGFRPPAWRAFRIKSGPNRDFGSGFSKGKPFFYQSWTFQVEARQAGVFTLEPASVVVDGRTLHTQRLRIRVRPAQKPPLSGSAVFVRGELARDTAYVGQQVAYRLKLYSQPDPESFDLIGPPALNGFYSLERKRFDVRRDDEVLSGKNYQVRTLHELALFPQESGTLTADTARARIGVQRPGRAGVLATVQETKPEKIVVLPLPEPAPEGFSGGVGTYSWDVRIDRDSLPTDEGLTLTVALRGNGDPRRFRLPPLNLPPGLECFEPKIVRDEHYETVDAFVHEQTAEYLIVPKEPGQYRFLPALVYFDTDSNRYHTLTAPDSIVLSVWPGPNYGKSLPAADAAEGAVWHTLKRLATAYAWPLALLAAVVIALWIVFRRRARREPAPRPPVSSRRASNDPARPARQQLDALQQRLDLDPPRVFYDQLLKTLKAYLAARLDVPAAQLTPATLRARLAERHIPPAVTQALLDVWSTCERAVFANLNPGETPAESWRQAEAAVQELERFTAGNSGTRPDASR